MAYKEKSWLGYHFLSFFVQDEPTDDVIEGWLLSLQNWQNDEANRNKQERLRTWRDKMKSDFVYKWIRNEDTNKSMVFNISEDVGHNRCTTLYSKPR